MNPMARIAELEIEIRKRDEAMQRICDELSDAAAFGRVAEPNAILAAVRSAYGSESDTLSPDFRESNLKSVIEQIATPLKVRK